MLLKELIEVYEQLELRNEVKTGWDAKRAVHFGIDVDNNGKILQIIPFSVDKSIKLMSVPATTEKETGSRSGSRLLPAGPQRNGGVLFSRSRSLHRKAV